MLTASCVKCLLFLEHTVFPLWYFRAFHMCCSLLGTIPLSSLPSVTCLAPAHSLCLSLYSPESPPQTRSQVLHTPLRCFCHHSYPLLFWFLLFLLLNSRLYSYFSSFSINVPFFCSRFKSRNHIAFCCPVSLVPSDL